MRNSPRGEPSRTMRTVDLCGKSSFFTFGGGVAALGLCGEIRFSCGFAALGLSWNRKIVEIA
jgi:hypothetical protein